MSGGAEDLAGTYGALLLGGLVSARYVQGLPRITSFTHPIHPPCTSLSGVVTIQTLIYYKLFPGDAAWRKVLVLVILFVSPPPSNDSARTKALTIAA
jgi:hypothetical protein